MLRETLAGFEVPVLRAYEVELAEGSQRKSMSALTGLVARMR